jgi:rubrerythrin
MENKFNKVISKIIKNRNMKEFSSLEDILDFAIASEQEAVEFYTKLANMTTNEQMKAIFEDFAREEIGHKAKLTSIKSSGVNLLEQINVPDLRIADYVENVEVRPNITYQEALVIAMKREKSAFKLYTKLSERAVNPDYKSLFLLLAIEESKHKFRFEI